MKSVTSRFMLIVFISLTAEACFGFTLTMSGDEGVPGTTVWSPTCQLANESAFTGDSSKTYIVDTESYSGGKSIELNVTEGQTGFGSFGGTILFNKCTHAGGRNLVKGDEIWLRMRIKFPTDYELTGEGRNKFIRFRTFYMDGNTKKSAGYNDLYLDAPPGTDNNNPGGYAPFQFIYEGAQHWFRMPGDWMTMGQWNTIEFYLKLDDETASQGGTPWVRVWLNGDLFAETNERNTLYTPDTFVESLYLFTYFGNDGAPKTQSLWIDDFVLTTDEPLARDEHGNPFIGMGIAPPNPPILYPPE